MPKKRHKLKADTVVKGYWRDNEQFEIKNEKKAIRYSEGHKTGKKVIITLAGAVNCKLDHNIFEQGDGSMCTLFDEIEKEGEARGEAKGIIEICRDVGLSEEEIIGKLQDKSHISKREAERWRLS